MSLEELQFWVAEAGKYQQAENEAYAEAQKQAQKQAKHKPRRRKK